MLVFKDYKRNNKIYYNCPFCRFPIEFSNNYTSYSRFNHFCKIYKVGFYLRCVLLAENKNYELIYYAGEYEELKDRTEFFSLNCIEGNVIDKRFSGYIFSYTIKLIGILLNDI